MSKQKSAGKPLLPASAAAIISLFIPGLGQLFSLRIRRGLLMFGSFISIIGLFIWRLNIVAHREIGLTAKFIKSFSRQPVFIIFIVTGTIILWLWIIFDSYKIAGGKKEKGAGF